jgi:hypothetical protein
MHVWDLRKKNGVEVSLEISLDVLLKQSSMHQAQVERPESNTLKVIFEGFFYFESSGAWDYRLSEEKVEFERELIGLFKPFTTDSFLIGVKGMPIPRRGSPSYQVIARLPFLPEYHEAVLKRFELASEKSDKTLNLQRYIFD